MKTNRSYVVPIDYTKEVEMNNGATIRVDAQSVDGREVVNIDASGRPIVIPGIPPAPSAFNGQFIQVNVISITPR